MSLVISWTRFFWSVLLFLLFLLSCSLLFFYSSSTSSSSAFTLSSFRLLRFSQHDTIHREKLVTTWRNPIMEAISEHSTSSTREPPFTTIHAVIFPDQISIFLNYPASLPLFSLHDITCVYNHHSNSTSTSKHFLPPLHLDTAENNLQIIRCPLSPHGFSSITLEFKTKSQSNHGMIKISTIPTYRWDWLAYEAMIDETDNTTIVFMKGFNLRPGRLSNPTKFRCVYGWDFSDHTTSSNGNNRLFLRSEPLSVGQEVVRCNTPLTILLNRTPVKQPIKVSVRLMGRATLPSIAWPISRPKLLTPMKYRYEMCVCTMLRNQARFLREWITYHSHIGVQRWYIYDNNSDDDIDEVIESLNRSRFNITKHLWPWIKSQEAGFAHCGIRARGECKWVGFIDVDEFFHFPNHNNNSSSPSLHHVLRQKLHSNIKVGEIRTFCYNFGPSGHKVAPAKGVTIGYTCRVAAHERHKSIIRPEALSSSLVNSVHHFRLKDGWESVTLDRPVMVINHYKYQVWDVFKDKFYRRVATYVADWKEEENVGSKDRAPGLGTRPVQPDDWRFRFCEVNDTELRDVVYKVFADPVTQVLPWEETGSSRGSI